MQHLPGNKRITKINQRHWQLMKEEEGSELRSNRRTP
jgi:hypothetical protein